MLNSVVKARRIGAIVLAKHLCPKEEPVCRQDLGSTLNNYKQSNIQWLQPTRRYSYDFTAVVNTFRPQGQFSSPTILVRSVGAAHGRLLQREPLVRPRLCKPTCPLSPHPSPVTPAPFLELWGRVISMKALHGCFCLSIFVKRGGVECQ